MNKVKVSIFGDICTDRGYRRCFEDETVENIFGDSLEFIWDTDIAVANLECPLTDDLNQIEKTGSCLSGPFITAF